MKKCIVFGCGQMGRTAFPKLAEIYDLTAYADNNAALWGMDFCNLKVISPESIKEQQETADIDVVITINSWQEICSQLLKLDIKNIILWRQGLLYSMDRGCSTYPIPVKGIAAYHKKSEDEFHVLFVQTTACIRTHKIAKALSEKGIKVSLAYLITPPGKTNPEYADIYEQIFPICTLDSFIKFVNESEFDIIHSSNRPDMLSMLLTGSNKPIVHDCHDLSSEYIKMSSKDMSIEYIANCGSNGVLYPSESLKEEAIRKFRMKKEKIFVLENFISEELLAVNRLKKLSASDQELHCVYEGGVGENQRSTRYFEDIWTHIVSFGIHIHFYTNAKEEYCRKLEALHSNIHYEGNMSSKHLAIEMSKYDIGLCILNLTCRNKQYLEYTSPNKIYEYVNAGIPVATGGVDHWKGFVEENGFGKQLDMDKDIHYQLTEISKINIEDNILQKKGFTIEKKTSQLLDFYKDCINEEAAR